jgi:hypothetical protein
VFDPQRDANPGNGPFYLRVLVVAVFTVVVAVALWPSLTGFTAGVDGLRSCIALKDGWHADRGPTAADDVILAGSFDHVTPAIERAIARDEWANGPGACVAESRRRLIVTGTALTSVVVASLVGGFVWRRTRRGRAVAVAVPRGVATT